jgi:hypothetical protein
LTNAEPLGAVHASIGVDYNTTFTAAADVAFFYVDIVPNESYTGKARWISTKSTGKEVAAFTFDCVATAGTVLRIPFKYPLWVKSGQAFTVEIKKADGTYLKARAGVSDTTKPYRKTFYRTYTDNTSWHKGNAVGAVTYAMESNFTPNRVSISDADWKLNTTSVREEDLTSNVGYNYFGYVTRPASGTTTINCMPTAKNGITLTIENSSTSTAIKAVHAGGATLDVIRINGTGSAVSSQTTTVTSGSNLMGIGTTANQIAYAEGILYAAGDTNGTTYMHYRIWMKNKTTTDAFVSITVW